ncbi:MAG: AAA family ATPase [bacterium]|nr:AAA family ATPase [bacterium]
MEMILDYKIFEKVDETRNSIIYRGVREDDSKKVIIKVLKTEHPSPGEIARFKKEYELIKNIDFEGVIKTHDIVTNKNQIALILEDFEGITLQKALQIETITTMAFLGIALDLAETLGSLHNENIIHKDIKPQNILVNLEDRKVKITDFGISTLITHENEEIYNPEVIEGTLSYISPEQTGRMNRAVDYRTDLYSLGIVFYEMLTGKVPFVSKDPLEIIHFHIAMKPELPAKLNRAIPGVISSIVMKLLSKTAEDRYQSAYGLMADLKKCKDHLESKGYIESFELARDDIFIKFNMPLKLYGRSREIELLMAAFERAKKGSKEAMLISGSPGIGKSALVNEINKSIVAARGYFISGKYDSIESNIPYSSIIQAFHKLTRQILSESKERIDIWKRELLEALGASGKVITDVIPDIELIIGKQPHVPQLTPEEAQNRFHHVCTKFMQVFAKKEHPLVLFLDDIQWADASSIRLIKKIICDPGTRYFLYIAAYRDNELPARISEIWGSEELEAKGVFINHIALTPLDVEVVNDLVVDLLRCGKEKTEPLAGVVHNKTNGNPFFVKQFIKKLYKDKLLQFDTIRSQVRDAAGRGKWKWDIEKINDLEVTGNVVLLMAHKVSDLREQTRNILTICACIGNRFDLETASLIMNKPVESALTDITEALEEGLVETCDDIYIFSHDRIREAVYSFIPEEEKKELHLKIGTIVREQTPPEELEEKIFYIVNQLNSGQELLRDNKDKYELAALNLMAGKKARESAAYIPSFKYLEKGIALLAKDCWQEEYNLAFNLHVEGALAAYLSSDFEQMDFWVNVALAHTDEILDTVKLYEVKIQSYSAQNRAGEAVKIALLVLKLLGIRFPEEPTRMDIVRGYVKTRLFLAGKRIADLANLPAMEDPYKRAVLRIMAKTSTSLFMAAPLLFPLFVFKRIRLSVKYGNAPESIASYAAYGLILCGHLGQIERGYKFGNLALALLEKNNAEEYKAQVYFAVYGFIYHWKKPVKETLDPLLEGYRAGVETGNLEFATYCSSFYCVHAFYSGCNINEIEQEMAVYTRLVRQLNQETAVHIHRMWWQSALNFMGDADDPTLLIGTAYDEEKMLPLILKENERGIPLYNAACKLGLNYYFKNYARAIEASEILEKYLHMGLGTAADPYFVLYDSLTRLAVFDDSSKREQKKILKRVKRSLKKLRKWAHHGPMNYLHKYYLVKAELSRVLKRYNRAADYYDRAADLAGEQGFLYEEGLANELAGSFYYKRGRMKTARVYLQDARYCYERWGSPVLAEQLDKAYSQLILPGMREDQLRDMSFFTYSSTSAERTSNVLDMSAVMKASQAISGEIDLGRLLFSMMRIVMENAGAEKGYLILESGDDLVIEAEGRIDTEDIRVLQSIPVKDYPDIAASIIYYVERTKESVILNDAANEGIFAADPYIMEKRARSILCGPVINQGKLSGILYLENNLTTGAFSNDRIRMLKVLSSQAAISIENSRLVAREKHSAAMEREIEMARKIQSGLLPERVPKIPGISLDFMYKPMMGIGGDYIDINYNKEKGLLGLFICDVSGHGIHAAITASMVKMSLDFVWNKYIDNPLKVLEEIRTPLVKNIGDNYITACVCCLDINTGRFTLARAGHPPIVVVREKGGIELVLAKGRVLNRLFETNFEEKTITLEKGDKFVLYTDGITEAENRERTMLGADDDQKFIAWIKTNIDLTASPPLLCRNIFDNVIKFTGSTSFSDDFTVLVAEYSGPPKTAEQHSG